MTIRNLSFVELVRGIVEDFVDPSSTFVCFVGAHVYTSTCRNRSGTRLHRLGNFRNILMQIRGRHDAVATRWVIAWNFPGR